MTSNTTSQATSAPTSFIDRRQVIMVAVLLIGAALSVLNQTSVSPMLLGTINRDDVVGHILYILAKP